MKTQILIAALIAGLGVTAAEARPGGMGGMGDQNRPTFEELDTDANGTLSQEELQAPMLERFSAADTDGDGALSAEEMLAAAQSQNQSRIERRIERMVSRMDANEDGVLQMDEMGQSERRGSGFARMDANEDGVISAEEFESAKEGRHGRHDGGRHDGGRHGEGRDRG
ncbi:EF-hand domain-containing protein [Aestuariibius sp. HNIBRBA575]|uniref:EF-hand domain-containing protein n=1 Tax=Aestuariibius sp. HNIBRBA575 TaxID=3233343 RepID=UPI0034A3D775